MTRTVSAKQQREKITCSASGSVIGPGPEIGPCEPGAGVRPQTVTVQGPGRRRPGGKPKLDGPGSTVTVPGRRAPAPGPGLGAARAPGPPVPGQ
eukprot:410698-Hanusia_phi.AAC.1